MFNLKIAEDSDWKDCAARALFCCSAVWPEVLQEAGAKPWLHRWDGWGWPKPELSRPVTAVVNTPSASCIIWVMREQKQVSNQGGKYSTWCSLLLITQRTAMAGEHHDGNRGKKMGQGSCSSLALTWSLWGPWHRLQAGSWAIFWIPQAESSSLAFPGFSPDCKAV